MNGSEKGNFPNNGLSFPFANNFVEGYDISESKKLGFSFPWQNYEAKGRKYPALDSFAVTSPRFLKMIVARLSGFLLAPFLEYTPRRPPLFFFCKRVFQAQACRFTAAIFL